MKLRFLMIFSYFRCASSRVFESRVLEPSLRPLFLVVVLLTAGLGVSVAGNSFADDECLLSVEEGEQVPADYSLPYDEFLDDLPTDDEENALSDDNAP